MFWLTMMLMKQKKVKTIINAERLRLSQQPNIVEFIRSLNNEFEHGNGSFKFKTQAQD